VPGLRLEPLRNEADPARLGNGYFWIFPHHAYTSVGAVAPKHTVPPATLRRYLNERCDELGISRMGVPFEGATLEVLYRGFHFPGGVHLAGDAAGVPSSLTAEGIYAAIVTGEEVALAMLEPTAPTPKTRRWLRTKRRHDRLARWLARPAARDGTLQLFAGIGKTPWLRRPLASWLLSG
jgi:geranylgeranyl reductase